MRFLPHFTAEQQNYVSGDTFFCTCMQNLPLTASSVLSISVRNHAVHFVGQLVLEARNGPSGPACYEVRGGALYLVQAHVTGLGDLTLGKADKLGVPGEDPETLGDQDLKSKRWRHPKQRINEVRGWRFSFWNSIA